MVYRRQREKVTGCPIFFSKLVAPPQIEDLLADKIYLIECVDLYVA
jgi:hypothetical protein